MVKVMVKAIGEEKYFDGYLLENLRVIKKAVQNNWDAVFLIFGIEGSGKSTFTMQIAALLDPNFTLDNVCWNTEKFKEIVLSAKPFSSIVLDEAFMTFSSANAMTSFQKDIISMMTQIRRKNLYIFIISPTFFEMKSYLTIHRSIAAFHVYAPEFNRGFWALYSRGRKQQLYVKGKKWQDLNAVKANVRGRFTNWWPFDYDEYDRRKEAAIQEMGKKKEPQTVAGDFDKVKLDTVRYLLRYLRAKNYLKAGAINDACAHYSIDPSYVSVGVKKVKLQLAKNSSSRKIESKDSSVDLSSTSNKLTTPISSVSIHNNTKQNTTYSVIKNKDGGELFGKPKQRR